MQALHNQNRLKALQVKHGADILVQKIFHVNINFITIMTRKLSNLNMYVTTTGCWLQLSDVVDNDSLSLENVL